MSLDDPETGYNKAKLELRQIADLLRNGERKKSKRQVILKVK